MGKGDIKTGKGKRFRGTYGNTRQRRKSTNFIPSISAGGSTAASARKSAARTTERTSAVKEEETETKVAVKKAPAKKAATKKASAKGDDLKKIEGVGPKAAEAMVNAGLDTFAKVAKAKPEKLSEILTEASSRLSHLVTTTWPKQAGLAAEDKWDDLKALQDRLDGGVEK